jgi:hypothetical protein
MEAVLNILLLVLFILSLILFIFVFLGQLLNYRKMMKLVRYDQERIEKGDSVLLSDSALFKALQYSYEDFSKPDSADPLNIFRTFELIRVVFILTQICLVVGMIAIMVIVFKEFSSSEGVFKLSTFKATMFPILGCLTISFLLILFIKQFYRPLFVNQAYEKIKESQTKLNNVHTKMTNAISPVGDAEFYGWLNSETLDALHTKITEGNPPVTTLTKRLVTLSLRDYFMKEIPDYANSPVRNLFSSDPARRITNPGLYIRIDCTQLVQNYAYKYNDVLRAIYPNDKAKAAAVLTNVSTAVNDINQSITEFRLNAEPTLILVETYYRASTLYLFFVVFIVLAIVVAWYNLGCPLGKGVAYVKYGILWLFGKLKYLIKKNELNKNAFFETLKTNLDNVVKPLCVTKTVTPVNEELNKTSGFLNKFKLLMRGDQGAKLLETVQGANGAIPAAKRALQGAVQGANGAIPGAAKGAVP